jgi:hypothetical protein
LFTVLGAASATYGEVGDFARASDVLREAQRLLEGEASPHPRRAVLDRRLARVALTRGDAALALELSRRAAGREEDAGRDRHDTMIAPSTRRAAAHLERFGT